MNKKISLPIVIAITLVTAAIVFSVAYLISTSSMNAKLTDLSQKQALFSTLSDVDGYVREKYTGEIDEQKLTHDLCEAYARSIGGCVIYVDSEDASDTEYTAENGYTVMILSDGSLVVVLSDEQGTQASAEAASDPDNAAVSE